MLMMILAAMAAPVFVQHEAQQKAAPPCALRAIFVSKSVEPEKPTPQKNILPRNGLPKGPAVLQPGCKPDEDQGKSEDYPMA